MDLDAFAWLLTDDGQRLLARATEMVSSDGPDDKRLNGKGSDLKGSALAVQTALRKGETAEHVAAAMTQVDLRQKAAAKFGDLAPQMYFTPDGLE